MRLSPSVYNLRLAYSWSFSLTKPVSNSPSLSARPTGVVCSYDTSSPCRTLRCLTLGWWRACWWRNGSETCWAVDESSKAASWFVVFLQLTMDSLCMVVYTSRFHDGSVRPFRESRDGMMLDLSRRTRCKSLAAFSLGLYFTMWLGCHR